MNLSPLPMQRFVDNNGASLVGGRVFTYIAGTATKIATYRDQAGTLNANPVPLDFRGEANIWLDQTLTYKFVLAPPGIDDPPTNPIWTVDNISAAVTYASLTRQILGQILYPRTAAEIAAGITPTNYFYPPGEVDRYGTNTTPGTTDMTVAMNAAFLLAKTSGIDVVFGRTWPYLLTGPINATQAAGSDQYGFNVKCVGQVVAATNNPPTYPAILANHTGHVFDCSGAIAINWYDVSVGTKAGGSVPDVCFFEARNSARSSMMIRYNNVRVLGTFSICVRYNFGSEESDEVGCFFRNESTAANAAVEYITQTNIRALTSTFITISNAATDSTLAHRHYGGSYHMNSNTATADVFRLDGATDFYLRDSWVACPGRSIIYIDTANSGTDRGHIHGVEVENGISPTYAICFAAAGVLTTHSGWSIQDSSLVSTTRAIFAGNNNVLDSFYIGGITEAANRGLEVVTRIQGSVVDTQPIVRVINESKNTLHIGQCDAWTVTTRNNDSWIDCVITPTWAPVFGAGFVVTGALTVSSAIYHYDGKFLEVQFSASAATSIVGAAGAVVTGLPRANKDSVGHLVVTNQNTPAAIGTGYVNVTSLVCPVINVGANVVVLFYARYRVA